MATRLQLRTRAREAADQDNATFPTDTQYNTWIDESAADVWRRLVGAGWLPDRTTVTVTASGAASYTVGTDVHSVISVCRLDGATRVPLRRVKREDAAAFQGLTGQAECYELTGGAVTPLAIELLPKPSTGSYEVRYIKRFPGFTLDADPWYGPDGTDKLIVLLAARRGAKKEDAMETASALTQLITEAWSEILEQANWLDQESVPTVRDTRSLHRYDAADYRVVDDWNY